jgi:hypothetical protein
MKVKRVVTIFIIAFCLLSFTDISCLAEEPVNWGEFWNSSSGIEKNAYLIGISLGFEKVVSDYMNWGVSYFKEEPESNEIDAGKKLFSSIFIKYYQLQKNISVDFNALIKIMSDLYKNPVNKYISFSEIIFISCQKLRGESIESSLMELRKEVLP